MIQSCVERSERLRDGAERNDEGAHREKLYGIWTLYTTTYAWGRAWSCLRSRLQVDRQIVSGPIPYFENAALQTRESDSRKRPFVRDPINFPGRRLHVWLAFANGLRRDSSDLFLTTNTRLDTNLRYRGSPAFFEFSIAQVNQPSWGGFRNWRGVSRCRIGGAQKPLPLVRIPPSGKDRSVQSQHFVSSHRRRSRWLFCFFELDSHRGRPHPLRTSSSRAAWVLR